MNSKGICISRTFLKNKVNAHFGVIAHELLNKLVEQGIPPISLKNLMKLYGDNILKNVL